MSSYLQPKIANKIDYIRQQFPALQVKPTPVYFDGPGGTQIPNVVIESINAYLQQGNSNLGGHFLASQQTVALVQTARERMATLIGATSSKNIIFGANMTTLTLHMSRSISESWQAGDNIILSELDHAGNRSAWERIAIERGVKVHYLTISDKQCQLDLQQFDQLLNERTRLVAVTAASNVTGTLTDIEYIVQKAKTVNAISYIDAVHLLPHRRVNVKQIDCDFLACSVYKFFGPHLGVVYGKKHLLNTLHPYKVIPAPNYAPNCWETGTLNFEALAGTISAVDYIASLGEGSTLDEQLDDAYSNIIEYEQYLTKLFLEETNRLENVTLYGIPDYNLNRRTPTFALSFKAHDPNNIARKLGEKCICTWSGHLYADKLIEALSLSESGGVLRVGLTHYNTIEEVGYFFEVLNKILDSSTVE